ncbi:actin-like protein, putative [Plasmodium knowlesi strain H]|uniref:Actin-like protein, putative n=3 Tax=Plasmodium knowlesi TaxID=5850 RepID=A0A5K1UGA9_PLAKH|nr:actin-like protein, putative [Plasmodium knowlesi strain H]OTN68526.1 putative Actin-like protein [Plasmodium knowlesi]CAA9986508.1 actin-like protein, putative [Plasmodium knowlesi strain H]SBO24231.1 actin-like protein, putative [Plasmodium knowlesi strain H]SBO29755.1 actin-like protein, putative [Plasmodium knowlesi strain H]VVS75982.1 actin-like protein, putative [Plasmodium knowlesi strain H]|eukprot:XP_002261059.1 actin-like protein, putative [Plasmodium knowlesi strain H]
MNDGEDEGTTEENIPVVILDPGSWIIKMGVATEEMPSLQIPCLYVEKVFSNSREVKFGLEAIEGYTQAKYETAKLEGDEGDELLNVKMTFSDPRHPLSAKDFTDLFHVYNYLVKRLNIRTENYNLLVVIPEKTENLFITNLLNWAFKTHQFASISFIYNCLVASYYYGLKTALVVDLGERGSRVSPVAENHGVFLDSAKSSEIGGHLITKYISNFVKVKDSHVDYTLAQNYKELKSYISLDIDRSIKMNSDCNGLLKPYRIPYSNIYIDPKAEMLSHEIYFQPEFLAHLPGYYYNENLVPLSQLIFDCVCSCPIDLRKQFLNNIILVGGVSDCVNMHERLHKELVHILRLKNYSENTTVHVKNKCMSNIAAYLGCRMYAKTIYHNKNKWVTREDYLSTPNAKVVHRLLMWANVL